MAKLPIALRSTMFEMAVGRRQLALGDFKDSFTVAFNWLMKQQSSVAEGQCLFLPCTYFINGIVGHWASRYTPMP